MLPNLLLKVESLELAYGEVPAVRELSFDVAEGEIVTLIGANGAGKSTTLRGIAGSLLPRKGKISFGGVDVTRLPAHARTAAGIALVPEGRRVFPALTVRENLEIGGFKYRKDRKKVAALIDRAMASFPRLSERASQPAGTLSGGEQQMLALSRALMSEPRLLCMDEPSLGLAPHYMRLIGDLVLELKSTGMAVLLAEQNLRFVTRLADRVYVLESGEMRLEGRVEEMSEKQELKTLLAL